MDEKTTKNILERLERLEEATFGPVQKAKSMTQPEKITISSVNFDLNPRKFVKTYSAGMNGGKKFTLLVAYLVKGRLDTEIEVAVVEDTWNRMKAKDLMGSPYNRKYPTDAKTEGWVDSSKTGRYRLVEGWTTILG